LTGELVKDLRQIKFDPRDLNNHPLSYQQKCVEQFGERFRAIMRDFHESMAELINSAATNLEFTVVTPNLLSPAAAGDGNWDVVLQDSLNMGFKRFEKAGSALKGVVVAKIGLIAVTALVPPLAVVTGPAALPVCWVGFIQGAKSWRERRCEEACGKLAGVLQSVVRQLHRQAASRFRRQVQHWDQVAEELFAGALASRRDLC
jgi:hypothetical protein